MRREGCETGRGGKIQGSKSGDAKKLGVPDGKVPKSQDYKHKKAKVEGQTRMGIPPD
jgi:hypothetical protein